MIISLRVVNHEYIFMSNRQLTCSTIQVKPTQRDFFILPKIIQGLLPSYLYFYHNAISEGAYLIRSTAQNKINPVPARTKIFENLFFPY